MPLSLLKTVLLNGTWNGNPNSCDSLTGTSKQTICGNARLDSMLPFLHKCGHTFRLAGSFEGILFLMKKIHLERAGIEPGST